jgi:hypothetical protein
VCSPRGVTSLEEEIVVETAKIGKIARFLARRFLLLKNARFFRQRKNRDFFKNRIKNAKNRLGRTGRGIKSPISFFFCHSVFFVCGAAREEVCGGHQAFLRCAKAG